MPCGPTYEIHVPVSDTYAIDELVCGSTYDDDVTLCGNYYEPEADTARPLATSPDADAPDEETLELEEGELSGPASILQAGGDDEWIRLGSAVPEAADRPYDHVPRPASPDQAYGSFRRSDTPNQSIAHDWHVALSDDADQNGWSYASALSADAWHAEAHASRPYRRQVWQRYVVRAAVAIPVIDATLSANQATA